MKKLTLEEKKEIARKEIEKDIPPSQIKKVLKIGMFGEYELFGCELEDGFLPPLTSVIGYGVSDFGGVKCAYFRNLGNINFDNSLM